MSLKDPRKLRALIIYGGFGLLCALCFVYLVVGLRSLLLPMILGALLAYIFKPLVGRINIPFLPNSAKVIIVLVGILVSIGYATNRIKELIPNEDQQLVYQVRLQYKINDKFLDMMNIHTTSEGKVKGNVIYNLLKDELDPFMWNVNRLLNLTKEQNSQFHEMHKAGMIEERYFSYYNSNRKTMRLQENIHEEQETRNPSSTEETEAGSDKSIILALLNTLSTWLLLPFVFIFLLFDQGQIQKFFVSLVPNNLFELVLSILDEVDNAIGKYLRGTLLECLLVGLTIGVGLYIIGFKGDVAIAIGAVAGLTNAIPFLGPAIGLGVGLGYGLILEEITPLLPFVTLDNLFFAIFICILIAQLLDNTVFQPIVLGSAVNLHPLVVIIGVMGGSVIFGFAGMLLAIPSIVILKVVTETLFKELKAYRII